MDVVISADGTKIAYEEQGEGRALIAVDGATCTRWSGSKPELARLLAPRFTVYCYDRRGRGDSGDTLPYAVDKVSKLAMYEAPYNDDPAVRQAWARYIREMTEALAAGRRGDAAVLFMSYVGVPAEQIDGMRQSPHWTAMEAVAPTLAYDHAGVLGQDLSVPAERAARVRVPVLVIYGDASFPFMADTARTLSQAIPRAELCALEGQSHDVNATVLAPVLAEFFAA